MKKNNMLTIILIALVSITLLGLIVVVLLMQFNKESGSEPAEPTIDEILVASVDVSEITTNLADKRFARIQLKITTDSEDAAAELLKRDFQTKNIVIQELSEMTSQSLEGKQGKIAFQNTIKAQLNELMQEGEVQQVYITSYVIQ